LIRIEISSKAKKSIYSFINFFYLYRVAFEQLVCPCREAFAGLFSKNPYARGSARGVGGGRWALFEMTDV